MAINRSAPASSAEVTAAVVFYCLCSGGMLLVNALTVAHWLVLDSHSSMTHAAAGE